CMVVLLCARLGRRRGASEERQDDIYRSGNFFETVMRHFLAIGSLPVRVTLGSFSTALVTPTGLLQRCSSAGLGAFVVAVAVAAVAPPAQKEDLAALGPGTDDKSEGVHVPGAGAAKNWTPAAIRATRPLSTPRPRGSA